MLFRKCTIPVRDMAISIGKNKINTGVRMVPKPNPEKNVRREAKNATTLIITISIL